MAGRARRAALGRPAPGWLSALGALARPAFAWNHDVVMRLAGTGWPASSQAVTVAYRVALIHLRRWARPRSPRRSRVTTYTNIIDRAPFFKHLPADDQGYLRAARQEEMSHYLLEQSVTGNPAAATTFYYPHKMFHDAHTTLSVLVALEDAFIAAYLVGVRNFSTADLRVTAARIMGIESDHRTLARVLGGDVARRDGGPLERLTGLQGKAERIDPPNNNGYERTLGWTTIGSAVTALTPFIDKPAAGRAGFDTSRAYRFKPFTPKLPSPLGAFISFLG